MADADEPPPITGIVNHRGGGEGDGRATEYKVQFGGERVADAWIGASAIAPAMVAEYMERRQAALEHAAKAEAEAAEQAAAEAVAAAEAAEAAAAVGAEEELEELASLLPLRVKTRNFVSKTRNYALKMMNSSGDRRAGALRRRPRRGCGLCGERGCGSRLWVHAVRTGGAYDARRAHAPPPLQRVPRRAP